MAPNRQIGSASSVEELLLNDILKQIDRLIGVVANGGSGGPGTVTSVSIVSANGFAGSVATATTTPAITLSTTVNGILKGDGTAVSAAVAGTDYLAPNGSGAALTGVYLLASGGILTGANTFTATGTNNVTYNYATLGANIGFLLSSTSTDAASNTQMVFRVNNSGANGTASQVTYSGYFSNTKTGTSNTNIALYATSSGASGNNNRALQTLGGILFETATSQSIVIRSSSGADWWSFDNTRVIYFNTQGGNDRITPSTGQLAFAVSGATAINNFAFAGASTLTATSGTAAFMAFSKSITLSSGTTVWSQLSITGTYNITGGTNTIIGYDYTPTITAFSAGTHLAFRNTSGSVLHGATTKSANTGELVMILGNASTNATGAQTDGIVIHSRDSSDGSANATLALYTEQAPEATATFTQTHRIKIWWNNVEYWLSLDAV